MSGPRKVCDRRVLGPARYALPMPTTNWHLAGIEEAVPGLRDFRGTATRLHPRPGSPTADDSSIGGPLLWPADEPWPVCTDPHDAFVDIERQMGVGVARLEEVRAQRRALDGMRGAAGEPIDLGDDDRARLADLVGEWTVDDLLTAGPVPLLPLAQLYRRDVADFVGPDEADLCQLLWCPIDHEPLFTPNVSVHWRASAAVSGRLIEPPEPEFVGNEDYVPEPCVVHPEQVVEYPYEALLPRSLRARIEEWEAGTGIEFGFGRSIAEGCKVGGYASWHLSDPQPMVCDCGADLQLLCKVAGSEWDGELWGPSDREIVDPSPTSLTVGRGYGLWIWCCPVAFGHPIRLSMQ